MICYEIIFTDLIQKSDQNTTQNVGGKFRNNLTLCFCNLFFSETEFVFCGEAKKFQRN